MPAPGFLAGIVFCALFPELRRTAMPQPEGQRFARLAAIRRTTGGGAAAHKTEHEKEGARHPLFTSSPSVASHPLRSFAARFRLPIGAPERGPGQRGDRDAAASQSSFLGSRARIARPFSFSQRSHLR